MISEYCCCSSVTVAVAAHVIIVSVNDVCIYFCDAQHETDSAIVAVH